MFLVYYKDYICSKRNLVLLASVIFFIIFEIIDLQPLICLSYSFIVITIFSYIGFIKMTFLEYIGRNSLIFYLSHLYLMKIPDPSSYNKFLFIILVFVITYINVLLYDYYKKYITDKFMFLIKSTKTRKIP